MTRTHARTHASRSLFFFSGSGHQYHRVASNHPIIRASRACTRHQRGAACARTRWFIDLSLVMCCVCSHRVTHPPVFFFFFSKFFFIRLKCRPVLSNGQVVSSEGVTGDSVAFFFCHLHDATCRRHGHWGVIRRACVFFSASVSSSANTEVRVEHQRLIVVCE